MLRSILIGLDTSESSVAAQSLGIRWGKQLGCRLVGITIVDDPGMHFREDVLSADPGHPPVGQALVAEIRVKVPAALRTVQDTFRVRCEEAQVDFGLLEQIGSPHVQILLEAQNHDLVLLGQYSHFDYGWEGTPGETVERVIQDSPRPVVVVPEAPCTGESIVIAYDGSLQAARALASFVETGLAQGPEIHLVAAASPGSRQDAGRRVARAVEFLKAHEIDATTHITESTLTPAELILKKAKTLDAGLIVIGAYGQPVLKEFFLGSVTRTLLKQSTVPIYCFH
jgi:nucleotide-binding universal stress UspA family protein